MLLERFGVRIREHLGPMWTAKLFGDRSAHEHQEKMLQELIERPRFLLPLGDKCGDRAGDSGKHTAPVELGGAAATVAAKCLPDHLDCPHCH